MQAMHVRFFDFFSHTLALSLLLAIFIIYGTRKCDNLDIHGDVIRIRDITMSRPLQFLGSTYESVKL